MDNSAVEIEFDSFCKKVLKNEARDIYRKLKNKRDTPLSLLTSNEINRYSFLDNYDVFSDVFRVKNLEIIVRDDILGLCIKKLSAIKREIILLYYFSDMTDKEVAEYLGLSRQKVQYQRKASLKLLKEMIKVIGDD